jgi:Arc/MetJ family transcription regulator
LQYGLKYGRHYRTGIHMKTTVDLDEKKLRNVMKLKGIKTRKEAIDYALAEAERRAKLDVLLREPPPEIKGAWVREGYDVKKVRELDKPVYKRKGGW